MDGSHYAQYAITTNGSNPSGSITITLHLTAGQIVQVQNQQSTVVYGTYSDGIRSWFSGHMLYQI